MASLESAAWDGNQRGQEYWNDLVEMSLNLKHRLSARGIRVLDHGDIGTYGITGLDSTKFLIRVPDNDGAKVAADLAERLGVQAEFWNNNSILFLLGVGDSKETLAKLERALLEIPVKGYGNPGWLFPSELPTQILTPREAYFSEKTILPLKEAIGRICGETLSPYPPGMPVIVPGEIITKEIVEYIKWSVGLGIHWQGNADPALNTIMVIKER